MRLDQLPSGASVLVDANILVFEFQPHPTFGPICHRLLERIENQDLVGFTTAHLLAETAHRLMVIEAGNLPGWAASKVINRLKQQPRVMTQFTLFQTAVDAVMQSQLRVLPITGALVAAAARLSRQHGLLTNDALILAVMQQHGLTHLASADTHFNSVPGITRYAPA